jgi:2-alkenal reductase
MKKQFALIIAVLVLILGGLSLTETSSIQNQSSVLNQPLTPFESEVTSVVQKNLPSVVTVGINRDGENQDIGSGFIISSDGLIITNRHVVSDISAPYYVITNDNQRYNVNNIFRDPNNDLSIIKVDAVNLKPVVFGDSSNLKLGQSTIAIGTPLGEFKNSVTTGVVSGLGRGVSASSPIGGSTEKLDNLIQTDAPISSGNSGGPLLSSSGDVIGVNTAVSTTGSNLGFAIPVNVVKDFINNFNKQDQNFSQPFFGVSYIMINKDRAEMLNLVEGAYISNIVPDSPASNIGLNAGDIIVKLGNIDINENNELSSIVLSQRVGEKISISYWRNGQIINTMVVLTKI